jgi:hypothetical protein
MSDTTSAPAPAPSGDAGATAPPANTQPSISISEAGRILNQQRRKDGGEPPAAAEPGRRPSANEMAQQAKEEAATAPPAAAPPTKAATGLSAMERALGVPGVAAPEGAPAAAPPAADAGAAFEVEIEGQRLRTADDVREFARRKQADYTQKTQEIAQQRQALQQQQQALATVLPYIQPELARLADTLQRGEGAQMPDPALAETDPTRYVRERAAYDAAVAEQQRLGNLTLLQQQAHARALEQQVATANEQLAAEFPFWANPQERLQAQQQIVEWATTKGGFTKDELRGLADARQLRAMMKAAMFDRWVEGAKTAAPAPQLQAPVRGSPPPAPPTVRVQQAMERFDQKADIRNATALLSARRATNGQAR